MTREFEQQLRRANAERAWYIAEAIADGIVAVMRVFSKPQRKRRLAAT